MKICLPCSVIKAIPMILMVLLFSSFAASATQQLEYDEDWYHTCADKVAQETKDKDSLRTRLQVCAYKAVPKVCRNNGGVQDSPQAKNTPDQTRPNFGGSFLSRLIESEIEDAKREQEMRARTACIKRCMSANLFSRAFGECSKG